jgi:HK97 family phage major capsid protein
MSTNATATAEEQAKEFSTVLAEIKTGWSQTKDLPGTVKTLQDQTTRLNTTLEETRRIMTSLQAAQPATRRPGFVTLDCAEFIGSAFLLGNARAGRLDVLPEHIKTGLLNHARTVLGLEIKAALNTTDIPLPTQYFAQIRELISDFGVVRNRMFPFPIGLGVAKPPRFKTRPAFGSIAMSAAFPEKSPQIDFASLESHKVGGIVRVPREIDEQSIVPTGQFLARYGAVEFARAEDRWGFLADGNPEFDSVKGIVKTAQEKGKAVTLPLTKTHPSDATLEDFRAMRRLVNPAALNGRRSAYYLDTTWETHLPAFRSEVDPSIYQRLPNGTAILDGYPIVWTDVLQPYTTDPTPTTPLAVFGALDFWWFGEHGHPRLDFSSDVYFATDELAVRFIEEIDFDYVAPDATSVLMTPAA